MRSRVLPVPARVSRVLSCVFSTKSSGPGLAAVGGLFPLLFDAARSEATNRHSVEDRFAAGVAAGADELHEARRCLAVEEYVDAPFVVRKEPVPALVIRTVSEEILSEVAAAAIPPLHYQALIEVAGDDAGSGPRTSGCGNRPPAQPEVQRPIVGV